MPDGPRYIVTYLEVMPTATAGAVKLVRQFRDATRKEAGNLRAEALQRIGQTHHFVLLEAWKDQAAAEAHAKAPATAQFRDKIKAIHNAPIDERVHFPLSVGPVPAKASGAAVAVVTHVDVIPPQQQPRHPLAHRTGGGQHRHLRPPDQGPATGRSPSAHRPSPPRAFPSAALRNSPGSTIHRRRPW